MDVYLFSASPRCYMPKHGPIGVVNPQVTSPVAHKCSHTNDGADKQVSPYGKDGFKVSMDVHHFKADDIKVKTIDQTLIIEAQHEDKDDGHGIVSRHFIRKYVLPTDYDLDSIYSTFSSDGILTVKAPLPKTILNERKVEIQQIGAPTVTVPTANVTVKEDIKPEHKKKHRGHKK